MLNIGTRSNKNCDSIVYLRDGTFALLVEGQGPWRAHPISVRPYNPAIGLSLPWYMVGIYTFVKVDEEITVNVSREDVEGKGILFDNILSSWLPEWSQSKYDE